MELKEQIEQIEFMKLLELRYVIRRFRKVKQAFNIGTSIVLYICQSVQIKGDAYLSSLQAFF